MYCKLNVDGITSESTSEISPLELSARLLSSLIVAISFECAAKAYLFSVEIGSSWGLCALEGGIVRYLCVKYLMITLVFFSCYTTEADTLGETIGAVKKAFG